MKRSMRGPRLGAGLSPQNVSVTLGLCRDPTVAAGKLGTAGVRDRPVKALLVYSGESSLCKSGLLVAHMECGRSNAKDSLPATKWRRKILPHEISGRGCPMS